jgi:hypothetical protein
VRERISAACEAAGRKPEDVTLVAVTKTFPASDVRLLNGLGVRDFGENRDAEAAPKAAQCADLDLVWHFVGQLQTNKAASVARYATFVLLIEGLLANASDIQPSTVHADTQGQSAPVFALATLFGFDLMPRIRNFKDLIFFRPNEYLIYPHTDALFGERGRNVIDWKLIERHWQDLMQVAISISEGRLSSATLMRRLRSNSRKNRVYKVFREVGRSVRTVALARITPTTTTAHGVEVPVPNFLKIWCQTS